MPGITGLGTTYNLPNFVGELHSLSTEDTPFLSAIGGLTGGESANGAPLFTWQTYDLRDADEDRQRLEGADAPNAEERKRANGKNVLEIHQEAVALSYTKIATPNFVAATQVQGAQPVQNELAWQLQQSIKQVARDIEASFLLNSGAGVGDIPADNTAPRKTQGLLGAITTNVVQTAGPLTEDHILDAMQAAWDNGGIQVGETRTLMTNSTLKRALSKIFVKDNGYAEQTRNVGGVNLQVIETDFGRLNIMLNRFVPADQLAIISLDECAPVYLDIPGKGHFFAEPLAKTGASEKVQLYGEIGLRYGIEKHHAKVTVTAGA